MSSYIIQAVYIEWFNCGKDWEFEIEYVTYNYFIIVCHRFRLLLGLRFVLGLWFRAWLRWPLTCHDVKDINNY